MLKLKHVALTETGLASTYEVVHNVGLLPTTLTQDIELVVNPETGKVTGRMAIEDLSADSLEDAIEKMAEWCDRLAAGLRQPRKVVCATPVFARVPFDPDRLQACHREMYDALVARLKTCNSLGEIREHTRELVESKHPLIYVSGAIDRAEHEATLLIEEQQG